jgi:hypothetical protein
MPTHWIVDDPNLSSTEKLVMVVIERFQFHGQRTGISQEVIAKGAGFTVKTVQNAIASAETKGYPIVETRDCKGHATHYLVRQTQGILGSNANLLGPDRSEAHSSKTPGTSPSATPHELRSHPPPLSGNDVRTLSGSTRSVKEGKDRAEVRPRASPLPERFKRQEPKEIPLSQGIHMNPKARERYEERVKRA